MVKLFLKWAPAAWRCLVCLLGSCLALTPGHPARAALVTVRLAENALPSNPLIAYRRDLIELAVRAAGHVARLEFCNLPGGTSTDRRMIREVALGQRCDVLATSAGGVLLDQLAVVPVPIYLGGGGYRVLLVNSRGLELAARARSLSDLRQLRMGSGAS